MLKNSVKTRRRERELTQTQLAERVGVTRQTIAFIEKGEFAPSVALALRLAKALEYTVTELFWLEEEKTNE